MTSFDFLEKLFVFFQKLSSFWLFQKNNTGGFFGLSCNTELESASDENVWDFLIFTHDWDVADYVNG